MWKSPTLIVDSPVSSDGSISFCLLYFDVVLLGACTHVRCVFLEWRPHYHYVMPPFILDNFSCSGVIIDILIVGSPYLLLSSI